MAKFVYERRVYLADTDGAGVVYFNQFLQMCHEAYEHWLMERGFSLQNVIQSGKFAVPLIHAEIDFFAPAHCGDRLRIHLNTQLASPHRFVCDYEITKEDSPMAIARAQTQHVCIALPERKKCPLPMAWQTAIGD